MDYQVLVVDNQLGHWVKDTRVGRRPITLSDCGWSAASAQVSAVLDARPAPFLLGV